MFEPARDLLVWMGLGSDFDLREDVIVFLLLILITLLLLCKDLDGQLRLL